MDRRSILAEHINGNDRILFRNSPFWFDSFSKQGIQKINDIWDENLNNFINNDCMIDKLVDKQSGVRFYNIIKSSIPEQWLNTLQNIQVTENNNRETNTTSNLNKLKIKLRTNSIEPKKLSLKNIHDILRDTEFTPKNKLKWQTQFGDNLSWNNIWQNSLLLSVTNKEK